MLSEKLDSLMTELKISSVDIAGAAGFDRTNVSRLRSGSRQIMRDSSSAKKLVDGILISSENKNITPNLCSFINIKNISDDDYIRNAISEYLFKEEDSETPVRKNILNKKEHGKKVKNTSHNFGYKLDLIMNMTDLMNVTLSHILHVDASLISRYRKGLVTPRSNPELSENLSNALWKIIQKNEKTNELANIMSFPADLINEDYFYDWLCDFRSEDNSEANAIEKLLAGFNSFSAETGIALPTFSEAAPSEILSADKREYFGYEGLRKAVIRFLGNSILSAEKNNVIYLYSDQSMDWMVKDKKFLMKWASLMSMILKTGTRVKIIHNIDRSLPEMSSAILSWLPLYMSGMVESYYCLKDCGERFSHTIFLNPENYCIEGVHVIGTEKDGHYHYLNDQDTLKCFSNSFQILLKRSKPLVYFSKTFPGKNDPGVIFKEYPAIPFKNMKIWICRNTIHVSHISNPDICMVFSHPLMCKAFRSYMRNL
ncbi:MAG: hypothetical protein K5894_01925 [Lachnospiraceae bacterium]|nr:hypothetical protein [Lachnospiraceae bacterium]